jgi:hypothetical protein
MRKIMGLRSWFLILGIVLAAPAAVAQEESPEAEAEQPELPEQVKSLRQKVLESRARLLMLPEEVHGRTESVSAVQMTITNELTSDYRLRRVEATLDGQPMVQRDLTAEETSQQTFTQRIQVRPGAHKLDIRMVYQGNGYGLFPYMNTYEVKVGSTYTLVVPDQVVTQLTATIFNDGPLKNLWDERPKVRYDVQEASLLPRMAKPPTGQPQGQPPEIP